MRFVPVRHHSLGCHGSAYISIPYGWCLADARSSPISKFFHSTQSPGFKNACRRCKCSEIVPNSKNAKNRLFLEQKSSQQSRSRSRDTLRKLSENHLLTTIFDRVRKGAKRSDPRSAGSDKEQ